MCRNVSTKFKENRSEFFRENHEKMDSPYKKLNSFLNNSSVFFMSFVTVTSQQRTIFANLDDVHNEELPL